MEGNGKDLRLKQDYVECVRVNSSGARWNKTGGAGRIYTERDTLFLICHFFLGNVDFFRVNLVI